MKFTPIAVCRTRTWPWPGSPTAASSSCSTSGPPVLWNRTTFAIFTFSSVKEREHASVAIQPVVRNLAVAEEPDERQLAERIAYLLELRAPAPEHVLATPDAGKVQRSARRGWCRGAQLAKDTPQVVARGARIALAEQDLAAALYQVADRDQLAARVDSDQVAHEVVAVAAALGLPGTRNAQPYVDEVRGALEVAGEHVADILAEHVERGPPVEHDEHVRVALGDAMSQRSAGRCGVQRRAALRQPRRHANVTAQHD